LITCLFCLCACPAHCPVFSAYTLAFGRHKNLASLVSELKADSGLTADQLGRLLGVSRRSIHNWGAGSSVAAGYEKRIRELSALVFELDAKSADERRALLLDSSHGRSLFKQFVEERSRPQRVQYPVTVKERFGL
jgi:hypothetical protein